MLPSPLTTRFDLRAEPSPGLLPRLLQPFADRSPNASLATGNKCNTRHDVSLLNRF